MHMAERIRPIFRALILSGCLLTGAARIAGAQEKRPLKAEIARRDRFHVVDILLYKNKPDVAGLGMIQGMGTGAFWSSGHAEDSLDEAAFRKAMLKWKDFPGLFYIDIENWPTCDAPESVIKQSIAKFSRAIDLVREVAPKLTFGIYSEAPASGYWPIVGSDKAQLLAWEACNKRMAAIAKKVDVIFPSLYTFYDDEAGWDTYAKATLAAAKQYGKPVYAFLWPEYHVSNRKLAGTNIPGRVWRHELELTRQNADGVVLWNGLERPWDESADWWQETRAFLKSLPASPRDH
jgi:hypothetical protein